MAATDVAPAAERADGTRGNFLVRPASSLAAPARAEQDFKRGYQALERSA